MFPSPPALLSLQTKSLCGCQAFDFHRHAPQDRGTNTTNLLPRLFWTFFEEGVVIVSENEIPKASRRSWPKERRPCQAHLASPPSGHPNLGSCPSPWAACPGPVRFCERPKGMGLHGVCSFCHSFRVYRGYVESQLEEWPFQRVSSGMAQLPLLPLQDPPGPQIPLVLPTKDSSTLIRRSTKEAGHVSWCPRLAHLGPGHGPHPGRDAALSKSRRKLFRGPFELVARKHRPRQPSPYPQTESLQQRNNQN